MREFMDYVHAAFYDATGWRRDNSYSALNSTTDALLNFDTPLGLRLALSSLASSNFATSYQLGSVGVVDGSISYLFSSVPLRGLVTAQSDRVPLPVLLRSYRPLAPLTRRDHHGGIAAGPGADRPHESLLYGRLYLPQSQLEALLVRRLSPALQVQLSAVSAQHLRNGGTALGLAQYDVGRYALEGLASSDGGLLGFRGVYNFGGDVEPGAAHPGTNGNGDRERIYGRFSTGGEIYYGTLNKSGGVSMGARFATLPEHGGTPLAATLTLNPLMGNIAASYAVRAGRDCSLATRMEFNAFSYESQWAMGMELWRRPLLARHATDAQGVGAAPVEEGPRERSFQAKLEWRLEEVEPEPEPEPEIVRNGDGDDEYAGVLKARLDQNLRVGVLWEGRVKSLLFSLGSGIDLRRMDKPFRTLGLEIQFSS